MNVGVIGVGKMGKNHVRVYSEIKDVDKIYIYDVNEETAWNVKEHFGEGVVISNSLEHLFNNVDAVSICAATSCHFELIQEAMDREISFLVEKPVTLTLDEGKILLGKKNGNLIAGVGHIERFNPVVKEIKKMIKKPRYIEIRRHNPASIRICDTDVIIDLMIHDIDIIWNFLINRSHRELYSFWENDFCKVIAGFDDCAVALSASRIACKKIRDIYIEDEEFSIDGDLMNQEIYIYRKPQKYSENNSRYVQENIIEKVLVNKVEPLKDELMMFIDCIKKGKQFPVTLKQAVANLRIAEEIKEKRPIGRGENVLQASVGNR